MFEFPKNQKNMKIKNYLRKAPSRILKSL